MKIKSTIAALLQEAFAQSDIELQGEIVIHEATKPQFGDYQYNGIMPLAKVYKTNPRQIAAKVVANIATDGFIKKVEIAGAGFINIWLNDTLLSAEATNSLMDSQIGVATTSQAQTIIVDYSGPNMAKEMHVGHLRSTIIGDALAKLFEFMGHSVIRQNHIGDWGTQFGMLIAYLEEQGVEQSGGLKDLEAFYKAAKKRFDEDESFANTAREYVVKIQQGDKHCLELWERFINISLSHCEDVYTKLDVSLTQEDVRAESFYNSDLGNVITDLEKTNLLEVSEGAKCVFIEGQEIPVIVQKGDGGYLYATTDLAALRYRANTLNANRILYVVDARQAGHFKAVFDVAKRAGFVPQATKLEHIAFGTMMDRSGKPFKTRDGGTVKLIELLDEAVIRAKEAIKERESYSEDELETVAKIVGIGAVKYADLSINRESNYVFDWDKMLSFDGNTSLYMQYAYARIQSILKKYDGDIEKCKIVIGDEIEHKLILTLLKFEDVLTKAAIDASPHSISAYLYEVAVLFMKFYEQNPILKEGLERELKESRIAIATLCAKTIKLGLDILGIKVLDRL
ncbi:MAG: arginine--tRNA ligase [Campylobacterales bacterium]|nr:arginine--tRNA ligase [Campylobacterales bacterium]